MSVELFLNKYPYLNNYLDKIIAYIESYPFEPVYLEYYYDVDECWDKLFVNIRTGIDDINHLMDLEEYIYENCYYNLPDNVRNKISLSVM